jgi:tetratricopeptide (TPR) repeat protein
MKKVLLFVAFVLCSAFCKAQTVQTLADSAFAHQEYKKAFDYYADVVKTDPNAKAYRRMGYIIMNTEQELSATRFFSLALKLEPKDPVTNYLMGIVFMDAAKDPRNKESKADFKAKSATYLKAAQQYGSTDAKVAIDELNGI